MKWFSKNTTGSVVIMGRKTYESFPEKYRPLPNRKNIVITRNKDYVAPENVSVVNSIDDALIVAEGSSYEQKWIIGGGDIYKQALEFCEEVVITKVDSSFEEADTFFPKLNEEWREEWREDHKIDDRHKYNFSFIRYNRV